MIESFSSFVVRSLLNVCRHPTKFGGHKHCNSEGIIVLVCQIILQDRVTKGSCDFMGSSSSK